MIYMLNIRNAVVLSEIVAACQHGRALKWTPDQGETVYKGRARSICSASGGFLGNDEDVLDYGYLRVTGRTGAEHMMPMRTVLDWLLSHEMMFG